MQEAILGTVGKSPETLLAVAAGILIWLAIVGHFRTLRISVDLSSQRRYVAFVIGMTIIIAAEIGLSGVPLWILAVLTLTFLLTALFNGALPAIALTQPQQWSSACVALLLAPLVFWEVSKNRPTITNVKVQCDGVANVRQIVEFFDRDEDAERIEWAVVRTDFSNANVTGAKITASGQARGAQHPGVWRCGDGAGKVVEKETYIVDRQGHRSNIVRYSFVCPARPGECTHSIISGLSRRTP